MREEDIDAIVLQVEQWATTQGDREVTSEAIGERIMHHLYQLDQVAYVRFVSVYRSFETVEEFEDLLHQMEKAERVDVAGQRTLFDVPPASPGVSVARALAPRREREP